MNQREIKFRAWHVMGKQMIQHSRMLDLGGFFNAVMADPDAYELMQFTGLKDKNGKEIYEGDIVKAIAKDEYPEDTIVSDIILSEELSWVVRGYAGSRNYSHGLSLKWGGWKSLEVIGNLHENPELLKS